jgi:RimJ/RimL family protein N-acetyltransferase
LRLILGQDEIIAEFVGFGLKRKFTPPYVAMGWIKENGQHWRLVGGAVFNDYNGANIEVSIFGSEGFTRQSLRQVYRYVFVQCKCLRLTARTERRNVHMQDILARLGFVVEGELKNYWGPTEGQSVIMYRLDLETAKR